MALLKQIDKHGSISKAAKEMKMSYKKAWRMVNTMNEQGPDLLVTRTTGGQGGGGSILSETGKKAVKLFDEIKAENSSQLTKKSESLVFK